MSREFLILLILHLKVDGNKPNTEIITVFEAKAQGILTNNRCYNSCFKVTLAEPEDVVGHVNYILHECLDIWLKRERLVMLVTIALDTPSLRMISHGRIPPAYILL